MRGEIRRWALLSIVLILILTGCVRSSESSEEPTATPAPINTATPAPTDTPSPTSTPTATVPPPPATPTPEPTPTPVPEPVATAVTVGGCCPLFSWMDATRLVVYDTPPEEGAAAWLVDIGSGERIRLDAKFGLPSTSGLVAVPDEVARLTRIVDAQGAVVAEIGNGGALTWISPSGSQVAWIERLPRSTPSSNINRAVRLWVADTSGANARPALTFLASRVAWLPDDRRVLAQARAGDGSSPGVWVIDVDSGTYTVLDAQTFVQAVRVSPDGQRVAYLVTFSGDPSNDGLKVAEIDGPGRWAMPEARSYRWAGNGSALWIHLPGAAGANDRLELIDVESGAVQASVDLGARVLNDAWEVSPDGRTVAFWREEDRQVVVFGPLLTP